MCLNFASPALQARPGVEAAAPLKRCPTPPLGSLQSATNRISQPRETQKGCQFALNMFKMQVTAAIARREFVYSRGKRVGAAQFCMGPRKPAGQLQGAMFTKHSSEGRNCNYVETQPARHRQRSAEPRAPSSPHSHIGRPIIR